MPSGRRPTTPDTYDQIWRAATRYIHAQIAARLTVRDVACAAITSRRQLQRVFAEVGETTVTGYIADVRMGRAAQLAVESNGPVSAIAAAVGYSHPSAFIRAFRLHHGATPLEVRRHHRRGRSSLTDRARVVPAER